MHVCFCCFCFTFSVLSQEIGWEERLQNDLFLCRVGRKTLTQSISGSMCGCVVCCQPKVHVNYDFQARSDEELEIRRGEVITVIDNSDQDWYEGQVERDNITYKGYFPVSYVTLI